MALEDTIREVVGKMLAEPIHLPSAFWEYATRSWVKDAPVLPIGQIFQFNSFLPYVAPLINAVTFETTTSSTYGNLATTGPTLSHLPDGNYVVLFGAILAKNAAAANDSFMGYSVNSAAVSGSKVCGTGTTQDVSIVGFGNESLSNKGDNTIVAKYRSADNVNIASFLGRWMVAFKYQNP